MSRHWRVRYAGAKYHVTSRGNGRQVVFREDADYERFLSQLDLALEQDQVILYAYVLLPNHYHLLIETPLGNIQRFMQRLNTAYSMYCRYKHDWPGHCFQGRYGARLVQGEEYLIRLIRYIHLNPVHTKAMERRSIRERIGHLEGYRWSSYGGYVDGRLAEERVNYLWLKLMGRKTMRGNRAAYRQYVERMVGKEDEVLKQTLTASSYAIGDEEFREEVMEDLKEARLQKADCGDIRWPVGERRGVEDVEVVVMKEFGVNMEEFRQHGRAAGVAKKVVLELCSRYCGVSQREIGRHFGYTGNGAVGKQRRKLKEMLDADDTLLRRFDRLARLLQKP